MRSAYSYLCYIPDFGRVRSIYPNAAAPHKPPFDMTEFGLIDTIRDMFAAIPRNGFDGIGDDCTVFPLGSGESLVFTADLLAENIHFLRRATSARELGRKSLAVNLSDVAAMGARPIATLLSLAIPHDLPEGWIEDFMEGYRDLSAQYDVGLVGGDTTASDSGLVVNVTAIGRIADSHIKRRSDARPGDLIAVGGSLGESGAGLRDILAGRYDTPLAQIHRNPAPQVAEGIWLGERPEVHAMMDISDGIASDLRHILHQSGVGAEVDTECIPTPVDLETAVSGGEDYKLLFTVAPESANTLLSNYRLRFGDEFHFIGRITGGNHLEWLRNGTPLPVDWQGFRHYCPAFRKGCNTPAHTVLRNIRRSSSIPLLIPSASPQKGAVANPVRIARRNIPAASARNPGDSPQALSKTKPTSAVRHRHGPPQKIKGLCRNENFRHNL